MARETLTQAAWIEAGLSQLAKQGALALRAEPLARHLKTTKGSFYWHFKDVPAFHKALLAHWKSQAMANVKALDAAEGSAAERMIGLGQSVQADASDSALRAWAQTDKKVAKVLAQVDAARMERLGKLMHEMGNSNPDFTKAAYGSLIGLRQMKMDDGEALIAYASLIDLVLALK